ncbi:MAG: hypothetical protein QGF46_03555 [Planctomycetota bacterium]|nr:hypothetical protein [Planctomycetota bacterium]
MSELWHNFLPVAEEALENLEQDLNPHLVQKRIDRAAAELNCDVQITPKNNSHNDNFARFLLNGTGRYSDLVKLIDRLEQGQHYVRFEKLAFVMPSLDYSEAETGAVRITGAIMVPILEDYNQQEGI